MGSQTSTSRHQALGDVPQGRISGLRPVLSREFADDNLHVGANAGGTAGVAERGGAGEGHLPPYQRLSTGVLSSPDDGDELIPCLFSWSHGGHNVYLTGSFNEWSVENKIRLVRSGHEFSAVQMLLRGVHLYKFIVDDQWKFAPDQATQTDEHGNVNNILNISNFRHYNFKIPSEYEQAREAVYNQVIPEPSEYTSDAPNIPILLSKSTCMAAEFATRHSIPLHCISNHVYHDAQASTLFGPHVTCIAATIRWRPPSGEVAAGQRYATCIYVTTNPLYEFPQRDCREFGMNNCLMSLVACETPVADFAPSSSPTEQVENSSALAFTSDGIPTNAGKGYSIPSGAKDNNGTLSGLSDSRPDPHAINAMEWPHWTPSGDE
eukprot:GHVT01084341.1.p1 GENE.GHVT01084341.1~~GHVT01084341.1.p1  ORF type:complete len:378 (+),score=28.13 GHVT01084341.1:2547-3680(+)